MANEPNAILTQKIEVSPGLAILRVVPEGWDLFDFTPGQFAVLGLPAHSDRRQRTRTSSCAATPR